MERNGLHRWRPTEDGGHADGRSGAWVQPAAPRGARLEGLRGPAHRWMPL